MLHHSPRLAPLAAVALAVAVVMTVVLGLSAQPALASTEQVTASTYKADAVHATNDYRADVSVPSTKYSPCLNKYAASWAKTIANKGALQHRSTSSLKTILKKCKKRTIGENLAYGQKSGAEVVAAWGDSAPHRKNLVNSKFTYHGVGSYWDGKRWWTAQLLAG